MADELDALLERVPDDGLRSELHDHIDRLRRKRQFGLVFESHLPERVRLPDHPIRRGSKVVRRDAPPRQAPQEVLSVRENSVVLATEGEETEEATKSDLVVVAEFGEPIYPGFKRLGSIDRGGDKPAHIVIKGENYHTLEALRFSHAGKIDCIYIDPPYNTGARDWKYDNDYVDAEDGYRHSKWLAFMERRLRLAQHLLNPAASVLIVTIDEKEVHRLGLLLDQLFPGARIQMITSVINPSGSSRIGLFSRSDEYIFFVLFGDARIQPSGDDMLNEASEAPRFDVRWDSLRRRGNASRRSRIPSLFYPIYFESDSGRFHSCGDPLPIGVSAAEEVDGLDCVLPVTNSGAEMTWNLSPEGLVDRLAKGYVRYYRRRTGEYVIRYLQEGTIRAIESGEATQEGLDEHGFPRWKYTEARRMTPMTTWHRPSHSATDYGTPMVNLLLAGRHFPYPKSLYAVEDTLRFVVGNNREAVVLDFFAGSGTTAHAVMRLNRQDGGRRQSISVTNNEVSVEDADRMRSEGKWPGDSEWEAAGIFESIARPRIVASVTGQTPDGEPIAGDYRFKDEFPMAEGLEESVDFLELRYLDIDDVELDLAFDSVAPMLWMRASALGLVIGTRRDERGLLRPFATTDHYGVLFDPDHWREFVEQLPDTVGTVFVVTDSPSVFASVAAELPAGLDVVRLYENYLSTFAINRR